MVTPDKTAAVHVGKRDWLILTGVLVLAAGLRLTFFNGAFGSDDLVYLNRAVQISDGIWSSANYNGALRYGFNIPAAVFLYLFGVNLLSANLWPLLCSLVEIAAVYLLARCLWTGRVALFAALILAFMPLHVASATRIHADPVVACFLTLSFVTFYFAERYRSPRLYFLTGIFMGLVFWTKELAVVTLFAFLFYPLLWRKWEPRWAFVLGGGLFMLLAHFALMAMIAGDPLHAFKVVLGQVGRSFIGGGDPAEDGAAFYLRYLFLDIRHVWLAGIVAAWLLLGLRRRSHGAGTAYVAFWLLALVGVLSLTPVSLTPLKLVMKQPNYLTLFLAPLALLAGYRLAALPGRAGHTMLILTLGGGLVLAALEQQAYRVFISNSMAALNFARLNPQEQFVGSNNNGNIAALYSILDRGRGPAPRFRYMSEIARHAGQDGPAVPALAVLDSETMGWGKDAVILDAAPACWVAVKTLEPTGFGLGQKVTDMLGPAVALFPDPISRRLQAPLDKLSKPGPAILYRTDLADFWCERAPSQTAAGAP